MGTSRDNTAFRDSTIEEYDEGLAQKVYTPIQDHSLAYFKSMKSRRDSYLQEPDMEETFLRLLDRALYSAYRDCVESGVEGEAKAVLSGDRADD